MPHQLGHRMDFSPKPMEEWQFSGAASPPIAESGVAVHLLNKRHALFIRGGHGR